VRSELARLRVDPDFLKGSALRTELNETITRFESVATKKQTVVPDFIPYLVAVTSLMFLWVIAESTYKPISSLPLTTGSPLLNQPDFVHRPGIAVGCFLLLSAYVLTLDTGWLPFAVSTAAMVLSVGLLMTRFQRSHWLTLLQTALLTGLGTEFVFTHIFVTALP
jgi:hypothetical protein